MKHPFNVVSDTGASFCQIPACNVSWLTPSGWLQSSRFVGPMAGTNFTGHWNFHCPSDRCAAKSGHSAELSHRAIKVIASHRSNTALTDCERAMPTQSRNLVAESDALLCAMLQAWSMLNSVNFRYRRHGYSAFAYRDGESLSDTQRLRHAILFQLRNKLVRFRPGAVT